MAFDAGLRALTARVAGEVRELVASGQTPAARYESARCDSCSLLESCRPRELEKPRLVGAWLARLVEDGR